MANTKDDIRKALFDTIPDNFLDPLTLSKPTRETELSGLLAHFHQVGAIDWSGVPLRDTDGNAIGRPCSEVISSTDLVVCEYPLFCMSEDDSRIWGDMRADLLFISKQRSSVVLVENKIGSEFTGNGDNPEAGQLAKQAYFLIAVQERYKSFVDCALVVLSAEGYVKRNWYGGGLRETLQVHKRHEKVEGYQLCWEDILRAIGH